MESRQPTRSMQPQQASTSGLSAGPDATRDIGRFIQEAFKDACRIQRNANIQRGMVHARIQRAHRNNEGGK